MISVDVHRHRVSGVLTLVECIVIQFVCSAIHWLSYILCLIQLLTGRINRKNLKWLLLTCRIVVGASCDSYSHPRGNHSDCRMQTNSLTEKWCHQLPLLYCLTCYDTDERSQHFLWRVVLSSDLLCKQERKQVESRCLQSLKYRSTRWVTRYYRCHLMWQFACDGLFYATLVLSYQRGTSLTRLQLIFFCFSRWTTWNLHRIHTLSQT